MTAPKMTIDEMIAEANRLSEIIDAAEEKPEAELDRFHELVVAIEASGMSMDEIVDKVMAPQNW